MKSNQSTPVVNLGRAKPALPPTRRVNLSRLVLVVDPHTRTSSAGASADPDELAPPCPLCKSALGTLWFRDRRTGLSQLVCIDCTPHQRTTEFPETDAPAGTVGKHLTAGEFPRLA